MNRLFIRLRCNLPAILLVGAAGPSTNFNPCSAIASGFKGIDSTNRVNYVECLNYQVLQSLNCNEGSYFDETTNQCIIGTWVDETEPVSNTDPYCSTAYDGFVGLDSSNRITYIECFNYVEVGRYDCPAGFYFQQETEMCVEGVWDGTDSSSEEVEQVQPTTIQSAVTTIISSLSSSKAPPDNNDFVQETTATCDNISQGNVPLSSLRGYLVCSDGDVLVTEYCGESTLFDVELDTCTNYCQFSTANVESSVGNVILPKLAGSVTCDSASGRSIDTIVCSAGTYYDASWGYCRNFCQDTASDGGVQYVPFSNNQGGVTCENQALVTTVFCTPGTIYSVVRGICMESDQPTYAPTTRHPTFSPISSPPTLTTRPTMSISPTEGLELVMPVPKTEVKHGKKKPVSVVSSAFGLNAAGSNMTPMYLSMIAMGLLIV